MKRSITLMLLAAMLLSAFSCGEAANDSKDTTASNSDQDTTISDETVDENSRDAVPSAITEKLNFNNETITILTRSKEVFVNEFQADEQNGDTMNDAIYARNTAVEEQLGVKIKLMLRDGDWGQHTQFNSDVVKEVMAGATEYDMISYYAYAMPQIAQQNVLYNLNDIEYLDLSKPWWHQMFIENAEVYGKLYAISGDINLTTVSYRSALFFNKTLAEDYLKDVDLYKTVLDGKWTQEYLISLTKDIWSDLDGDTLESAGDLCGLDLNNALDQFPVGGGITYTKKTDDGGYEWDLFNERNNTMIERFYDAYNNNIGIYLDDSYDKNRFMESRSLFTFASLNYTENLRDFKSEYGILPAPKFDEEQEQYYSIASDSYSQIAVPSTCADTAKVGAVLELMGEYSYKKVIPAYYEVAMKGKYLRDDESCRMFDIIVDGAWYDFANINTSVVGDPVFITRQSEYHKDGKNFASTWAANEARLESSLETLLNNYKGE